MEPLAHLLLASLPTALHERAPHAIRARHPAPRPRPHEPLQISARDGGRQPRPRVGRHPRDTMRGQQGKGSVWCGICGESGGGLAARARRGDAWSCGVQARDRRHVWRGTHGACGSRRRGGCGAWQKRWGGSRRQAWAARRRSASRTRPIPSSACCHASWPSPCSSGAPARACVRRKTGSRRTSGWTKAFAPARAEAARRASSRSTAAGSGAGSGMRRGRQAPRPTLRVNIEGGGGGGWRGGSEVGEEVGSEWGWGGDARGVCVCACVRV